MDSPGARRLDVAAFINDFKSGIPEKDLQEKYSLDHSQLARVVLTLKKKGSIGLGEVETRNENIRLKFGDKTEAGHKHSDTKISVDLDTGLVLHCPSCGAAVKRGAKECEYCRSHLDFSLKGKTTHCPHCYQRIPADSRFCIVCAKPARKQVDEAKILTDSLCPRCQVGMTLMKVGDFSVVGCKQCQGLFIPHQTFEMMQDNCERVIEATGALKKPEPGEFQLQVSYVRCPECREFMHRQNFASVSGIILDVCRLHGIWFDEGEMEKIMDFIAHGGLKKAREAQLQKAKEEQTLAKLRAESIRAGSRTTPLGYGGMADTEATFDLIDLAGNLFNLFKK